MGDMNEMSQIFYALVYSIIEGAMIGLGKIKNPITGQADRNLQAAAFQIDILRMLREKTKGNLTKEEEIFLLETLSTLELNYVEEKEREDKGESSKKQEQSESEKGK